MANRTLYTFLKEKTRRNGEKRQPTDSSETLETSESIHLMPAKQIKDCLLKAGMPSMPRQLLSTSFKSFLSDIKEASSSILSNFNLQKLFGEVLNVRHELQLALCEERYFDSPLLRRLMEELEVHVVTFDKELRQYTQDQSDLLQNVQTLKQKTKKELHANAEEYQRVLEHQVLRIMRENEEKVVEIKTKLNLIESNISLESKKNLEKMVAIKATFEKEKMDGQFRKLQHKLDKAQETMAKKERQCQEAKNEYESIKADYQKKIIEIESLQRDLDEIRALHTKETQE